MKKIICQLAVFLGFGRREEKNTSDSAEITVAKQPGNWRGVAGVSVGSKHLKAQPPVPCQDAAYVRDGERVRPCVFVADGAGSAKLSHLGAAETTRRLAHFSAALEDINARMLDMRESPSQEECDIHARRFLIHAAETVGYLAAEKKFSFKEFHCTLLAVIVGSERIFWMKVGDGHIVREKSREHLQIIGDLGKGEFANITTFIKENAKDTIFNCGLISADDISGFALMTDGAAEKLVSNDGKRVAGRLSAFLSEVRQGKFGEKEIQNFLTDSDIWKPPGYTGDDKGVALLSRLD